MNTAIIITTFMRDELLFKSIQSILDNMQENFKIIIVDQGHISIEKRDWLEKRNAYYCPVPFNSGLSFCRNFGVQKAKELGCDYTIIGSDSFLFNKSIQKINDVMPLLNKYGLVGFDLENSTCRWEGKLNLIEGQYFELDFINPSDIKKVNNIEILECECMRNCFLTKTDNLLKCKWDEKLFLGEHEDFMYRFKLQGFVNCWTKYINIKKMNSRQGEYAEYRKTNFNNGIKALLKKYNIKSWINYKNHQYCK